MSRTGRDLAIPLVVLIATRDRTELLAARALASIVAQDSRPNAVVVVDDSDPAARVANARVITRYAARLGPAHHLANARTRGAAGAWNTGIEWCRGAFGDCWVALLDDDDTWEARHLAACRSHAVTGVDAVLSGIRVRLDGKDLDWQAPGPPRWREFLSGNPGWQGSNTFVRCSRLIEAGCFDETLDSTHDRDLAIRLLRLPDFRVAITGACTVTYHLERSRLQLSTAGAERKRRGLATFWSKHHALMNAEDSAAFFERARTRFGFEPHDLGIVT